MRPKKTRTNANQGWVGVGGGGGANCGGNRELVESDRAEVVGRWGEELIAEHSINQTDSHDTGNIIAICCPAG